MCRLYRILQDLIFYSDSGDVVRVNILSRRFSKKSEVCYTSLEDAISYEYDNCRQSCLISVSNPEIRDIALADARDRFRSLVPGKCSRCNAV